MDRDSLFNNVEEERGLSTEVEAFENVDQVDQNQPPTAQPSIWKPTAPTNASIRAESTRLGSPESSTSAPSGAQIYQVEGKGAELRPMTDLGQIREVEQRHISGPQDEGELMHGFAKRALSAQPLENVADLGLNLEPGVAREAETQPSVAFDPELVPGTDRSERFEESTETPRRPPTGNNNANLSKAFPLQAETHEAASSNGIDWDIGDSDGPAHQSPDPGPDPFRFLGQVKHTNSFPDVPPLHNPQRLHRGEPLPQSQVETIMEQDSEQAAIIDARLTDEEEMPESGNVSGQPDTSQFMAIGSVDASATGVSFFEDLNNPQSEELAFVDMAGARYEEGMPLMPPDNRFQQEEPRDPNQDYPQNTSTNPFGTSLEGDEDFFGQSEVSNKDTQSSLSLPPLDRKSTTQVLGALSFPSHHETHKERLLDSSQEAGLSLKKLTDRGLTTAAPQAPAESPSKESVNNATSKEEDLAALWKAALEEDEFLDDDLLDDAHSQPVDESLFPNDEEEFMGDPIVRSHGSDAFLPVTDRDAQAEGLSGPNERGYQINGTATGTHGKYARSGSAQQPRSTSNPYAPATSPGSQVSLNNQYRSAEYSQVAPHKMSGTQSTAPSSNLGAFRQASNSALPRPPLVAPGGSQSFADQSKGGYSSPYDLPTDISRPRKRVNLHQAASTRNLSAPVTGPPNAPPPRSSSMYASQPPPSSVPTPQVPPVYAPPVGSLKPLPKPPQPSPTSSATSKPNSFFEDLPLTSKPRPSSGAGRYASPPTMSTPPPPQVPPKQDQHGSQPQPSQRQPSSSYNPNTAFQMRPPERINPYAAPPTQTPGPTPHSTLNASRYSPAPPPQPITQQVPNRNTPIAPWQEAQGAEDRVYYYNTETNATQWTKPAELMPSERGLSNQSLPNNMPTSSQTHAYLPRTSSPLAYQDRPARDLTSSQSFQGVQSHARSRTSSQASTRRVLSDSETSPGMDGRTSDSGHGPHQSRPNVAQSSLNHHHPQSLKSNSRYAPDRASATPPPPRGSISQVAAGSKVVQPSMGNTQNPVPNPSNIDPPFAPPRRSQTQSPGSLMSGPKAPIPKETSQRPASAHAPTSPTLPSAPHSFNSASHGARVKGSTQEHHYITPTDGRELDPLQRWKGCPVFAWGFGGVVVSSFPKEIPRYAAGQTIPMMKSSPGEIKIRNIKEVYPLEAHLSKFPGPLRAKGRKKDIVTWLSTSIEQLESGAAVTDFGPLVYDPKRREEGILLWKLLRVFVEHDGVFEGNPAVEKAVRLVLSPEVEVESGDLQPLYANGADLLGIQKPTGSIMRSEPVDAQAVEELRKNLLKGDREKAVWHAVDKRLWAHAMLISSTLNKAVWKQVIQEFVRQEVKNIGDNTESLAALYEIFAGNWEESIDELVPPSARAGHQMVSTAAGIVQQKNALDGLDRWRETLGLVLSNRSTDDSQALMALGGLLSGYGRVEAAHICYMFARSLSIFGGADDPKTNIALVGADHVHNPFGLVHSLEPLLLSEVYEFGLSLATNSPASLVIPHLQAYKLYHAVTLVEYGYQAEALEYCLTIAAGLKSTTKPSPYYNASLFASLDDLTKRLQQSPKDGSSGWISTPSMGKVSNSVWSSFEKFIAGDESSNNSTKGGLEVGPFSRIAGDTPVISRSPSNNDIYGSYGGDGGVPSMPMSNSRYAPAGPYAPRSSLELPGRPSQDHHGRSPYDPGRSSLDSQRGSNDAGRSLDSGSGSYEPAQSQFGGYEPRSQPSAQQQSQQSHLSPFTASPYAPSLPLEAQNATPQYGSYQPVSASEPAPAFGDYEPQQGNSLYAPTQESGGYEPPAASFEPSGYEPPAYDPETTNGDLSPVQERPKKKFMDDDDDDDYSTKPSKTKAQKDADADAAFKKAAAEDAKKSSSAAGDKKGWFGGWFSSKKDANLNPGSGSGPIRAKLGEESSFYYDSELKKWVNKKAGAEAAAAPSAPPPPPKGGPRAVSGSLAPPSAAGRGLSSAPSMPNLSAVARGKMQPLGGGGDGGTASAGPGTPKRNLSPAPASAARLNQPTTSDAVEHETMTLKSSEAPPPPPPLNAAQALLAPGGGSAPGSISGGSAPPSRPGTAAGGMGGMNGKEVVESIDDLLGAPAARKGGTVRKGKKGRGYVDVLGGGGGGAS